MERLQRSVPLLTHAPFHGTLPHTHRHTPAYRARGLVPRHFTTTLLAIPAFGHCMLLPSHYLYTTTTFTMPFSFHGLPLWTCKPLLLVTHSANTGTYPTSITFCRTSLFPHAAHAPLARLPQACPAYHYLLLVAFFGLLLCSTCMHLCLPARAYLVVLPHWCLQYPHAPLVPILLSDTLYSFFALAGGGGKHAIRLLRASSAASPTLLYCRSSMPRSCNSTSRSRLRNTLPSCQRQNTAYCP